MSVQQPPPHPISLQQTPTDPHRYTNLNVSYPTGIQMPVLKISRKGRSLQHVSAGLRGGAFTRTLPYTAARRWEESLKTRPNRLIPPPGYHRTQNDGPIHPPTLESDIENPYHLDPHDIEQHAQHNMFGRSRRAKAAEQQATAANWIKAEQRMIAFRTSAQRPVLCDCPTEDINARFISLESYEIRMVPLCICGQRSSSFVRDGFSPSTPVKPRTFFSIRLLRLLHEQGIRGGPSKYAWAAGLRAVHEMYMAKTLPDFYDLLLDAYHHFVAVENGVEAYTSMYLQTCERAITGDDHSWEDENVANSCPACFDFSHHPADRSVGITIDGNFQHIRFKDRGGTNHEYLEPRKFVSYGIRDFSSEDTPAANNNTAGCDNRFHARGGWGKTLNTSSKKHLDVSGLMGMTCFHGERQSHGVELVKDILQHDPAMKVRLCYDVSCVFVPALERLLPQDARRVQGAIARFHIYAHKYACHVLWSTLRLKGFGLMVGEEIEQHWYMLSHLIASRRVTSGPRKMQKIDSCSLSIARRALETFGKNLERRWKKAKQMELEESAKLQLILRRTVPERRDKGRQLDPRQSVTVEYLDEQASDQIEYFTRFTIGWPSYWLILEWVAEEVQMVEAVGVEAEGVEAEGVEAEGGRGSQAHAVGLPVRPPLTSAELRTYRRGGEAIRATDNLFNKHGERRDDPAWQSPDGEKFRKFQQRAAVSALHKLQTQLIHHLTERSAELELLHRRIGQEAAKTFLNGIRQRSKALDNLVQEYNQVARGAGVRTLDAERLRDEGLDNEEIWDVDLFMARGDWAVYDFVRAGIEARARLERVEEERTQLRLHAKRIVHWAQRRLAILLQVLDDPEAEHLDKLKTIIIHHYRVIKCLLKVDAPLFEPEERAMLLTSQRRIILRLDPENIAETVVEQDEDADTVGSDDEGIDREFDEDELGEFISDRLQNVVNVELGNLGSQGNVIGVEADEGSIDDDDVVERVDPDNIEGTVVRQDDDII
ncbi:hypothetical protein BZA77DRAFT_346979 [Pyronema omphalodes]|nr:hypothetical protein BZA77DRAFT_346979 [Pyronema omphalodes]